jgi:flagellar basal-body rod protein FlgC
MFGQGKTSIDISSSGLSAERYRMEVIANNIANANVTRAPDGGPYRRQQVIFKVGDIETEGASGFGSGVAVDGVEADQSEFQMVYNPGHPDADENGMVAMPNVQIPYEMVDLITATRAYEANLKSIRIFREMAERTLSLLRGNR